jgi:hypothetical protein
VSSQNVTGRGYLRRETSRASAMPLNDFPIPSFLIRVIRAIRGPPPSVVYFREPVVEDLTTNRTNRTNRVIGCEFTERDWP